MNRIKKPFIIILYGATATGKTDIALSLGDHIPIEIVNMDVGQFYTPFAIGTAKPDWQKSHIPHHLFDSISSPRNMTIVEYRARLIPLINDIIARGAIPVLVGGSSFYLHSLLFVNTLSMVQPTVQPATIVSNNGSTQNNEDQAHDNETNWNALYAIDPERALTIGKNDTYRIERALAIWRTTQKKPTEFSTIYCPPSDFLLVHITRDTADLNQRINERVHQMMMQGWLEEVRTLQDLGWANFIKNKKLIGYNELLDYTEQNNSKNLAPVIECIQQRTRQYAKRQRTFGRKIERDMIKAHRGAMQHSNHAVGCIETINVTTTSSAVYTEQLAQRLQQMIMSNQL